VHELADVGAAPANHLEPRPCDRAQLGRLLVEPFIDGGIALDRS
jgi:hypothetical protein